jgi:hypothetical protein
MLYIIPLAWRSVLNILYLFIFIFIFIHHSLHSVFIPKMADRLAFMLFGDQSIGTYAFLSGFYRETNQGILSKAFLNQAGEALRNEIESLGRLERSKLPVFKTLQQLNEKYHAEDLKHPGLDAALLCITQLAHYIECVYPLFFAFISLASYFCNCFSFCICILEQSN